ncbi:MAG: hypothetical protein M0R03_08645 [Novosphingobium sp.]|nr:hypothetical protein [Novosphingobium sp.]
MKFLKLDSLQNMMTNILEEGQNTTWLYLEEEKTALKRIEKRKLYYQALQKIKKGK